ncbi:MAG TPA: ribosome maturation factor RimM [Pyrinomonadaceae bacterium]|nr:ribosome maturation factor RimM [Pyrinomonadaceae bacterium]
MDKNHRLKSVPPDKDDLIVVAHIVKTRGLRGEVVADLLTDFPDRFENLTSLIGLSPDESRRSLEIEEQWFHGNRLVLKFAGFDSIDEAKELVGYDLAVPAEDRVELPKDSFYEWELIGCRVETVVGAHIGEVAEVMRTGGVEILKVIDDTGRDRLIPMASDIVVEIDKEKKLVRIDPPEGLLEL